MKLLKAKKHTIFISALGLALVALIAGCAGTHQARHAEPSGFLRDYSQLHEGEGDKANLVYLNPAADFGRYRKIMMDPIVAYTKNENSSLKDVPPEDLKKQLDYFN